jgi:hypothetical protein
VRRRRKGCCSLLKRDWQRRHFQTPELLCATAKELAKRSKEMGETDQIEKFKSSCTPSDYRLANKAYHDARYLLIDVRNLLNSMRGLAGRQ